MNARSILCRPLIVLALALAVPGMAMAAITITDPTQNPVETWTCGNNQSVSFTKTMGYSTVKIQIYNTANPSLEYFSQVYVSSGYDSYNLTVPTVGNVGDITACTIQVTTYDVMQKQLETGTGSVNIQRK